MRLFLEIIMFICIMAAVAFEFYIINEDHTLFKNQILLFETNINEDKVCQDYKERLIQSLTNKI